MEHATENDKQGCADHIRLLFPDLVIPEGLTFADLKEAAIIVYEWERGDEPTGYEVAAKVFEHLLAARAKNLQSEHGC